MHNRFPRFPVRPRERLFGLESLRVVHHHRQPVLLVKLASWVTRKFEREPDLGLICALVCVFFIDIATITGGASQSAASWTVITCVPSALLVFLVFLSALERSRPRSAARLIKRAAGGPETAPAAPARE